MIHRLFLLFSPVLFILPISAAEPFDAPGKPEIYRTVSPTLAELDTILKKRWDQLKIPDVPEASDAVFVRRAYLNATGRIPTLEQVLSFLQDTNPDKHARLIDSLLTSEAHADLMAMRFADLFRIKSEFPVNLWPNAVQAFHQQLRRDILRDRPYSEMVKELLTASGSNFRVPYANFFRGTGDRTPAGLAKITALSFMGLQLDSIPEAERKAFIALFSRIRFKSTVEWKEEIVFTDPEAVELEVFLPGSGYFTIHSPAQEPRQQLATLLIERENPYFARAFVNRAWHWFFGNALIEPLENISPEPSAWICFLRSTGIADAPEKELHPELLSFLTNEFRRSNYSMRKLFTLIMNSAAYRASSITEKGDKRKAEKYFATYPIRRLEAELVVDAFGTLTGNFNSYSSVIPEPFTFLPQKTHAVQIPDGSISSAMLDLFGRPPRDTGLVSERINIINGKQRLYLMNSGTLYRSLQQTASRISRKAKWNLVKTTEQLYLAVLSRYPTQQEVQKIRSVYRKLDRKQRNRFWQDLIWVLVNSKEFLYHH